EAGGRRGVGGGGGGGGGAGARVGGGTSPVSSCARTSDRNSTGQLETAATKIAPPTCARPMTAARRVGRSPRSNGAANWNANQCARTSPTAVPHTSASRFPPTAPVRLQVAKWPSGSAASSAISITETYRTIVTASRKISVRWSLVVVAVASLVEAMREACQARAVETVRVYQST